MKQGEIVMLEFPFSNVAEKKWRPAVVLSNERYNRHANVLLAGVYGKKQPCSVRITITTCKNTDCARRPMSVCKTCSAPTNHSSSIPPIS